MSTKHTPGPWFVSYTHDGNTSIAIDDEPGMQGERDYNLAAVTHGDPDELLANAKLVAAAPELLAALIKAERELSYHASTRNNRELPQIRAAISKATE